MTTMEHHNQNLNQNQHLGSNLNCSSASSEQASGNLSQHQRQYFLRSSFNSSIRTRRSQRRSGRRSSRRARPGGGLAGAGRHNSTATTRQVRQVRFQAIPQAIDISAHSELSTASQVDEPAVLRARQMFDESGQILATSSEAAEPNVTTTLRLRSKKQIRRVQQQLTRLSRKSRIQLNGAKPKLPAKPAQLFTNIKTQFGKIKLKTLNNLASQLQQTLTINTQNRGSGQFEVAQRQQEDDATPVKLEPIQRTFHLRQSAASAKHQIQLRLGGKKSVISVGPNSSSPLVVGSGAAQCQLQPPLELLDDGWGSDFDESQSTTGNLNSCSQQQLERTNADENSLNSTTANLLTSGGGYLLEIGKSKCDTRAVGDVIQSQGISGQFKRLQDASLLVEDRARDGCGPTYYGHQRTAYSQEEDQPTRDDTDEQQDESKLSHSHEEDIRVIAYRPPTPPPMPSQKELSHHCKPRAEQQVEKSNQVKNNLYEQSPSPPASNELDEDAAEEEAELRSLEARQNFKQVRDKLKLILERRLATYGRDLTHQERPQSSSSDSSARVPVAAATAAEPQNKTQNKPDTTKHDKEQQADNKVIAKLPPNCRPVMVHVHPSTHQQQDAHFDDCRSNCSEASSLSSGGLESNHSGSQDSGHSTQHSADDGCSSRSVEGASRNFKSVLSHHLNQKLSQQLNKQQSSQSCDSTPTSASASSSSVVVVQAALSSTAATTRYPLDSATRTRLLEQQRQMSLNLKQKPRRRTAKRALNLECPPKGDSSASSSTASPPSSASSANKDNILKPAQSLRQLIKEVIDDCEKPGMLSTLTRSILNRSDSLSSQDDDANSDLSCPSYPPGSNPLIETEQSTQIGCHKQTN